MINLIAEIGINHKGNYQKAINLIDQAASAGCWAVKFQFRDVGSFYKSSSEIGDEILLREIKRTDLSSKKLADLASYARSIGLNAGVSFYRYYDFQAMGDDAMFFDFYKVPSAECTNHYLIRKLLDSGKKVMVSTGGHSLKDIEKALSQFINDDIVIFHCVANYPAKLGSQNLQFIYSLKELGFKDVGYSSHDEDSEICFIAMSMGIKWIERHLTDDVEGDGLDDSSSSEISDFFKMNSFSSQIDNILGKIDRAPNQGEILNMQNLGTSLYAKTKIKKNSMINISNFEIKVPRVGLSPGDYFLYYENKKIELDLEKGDALTKRHFKKNINYNNKKLFDYGKKNLIGIPVRLHDFNSYSDYIKTETYEFHLSYEEVLSKNLHDIIDSINPNYAISIHLPDYLPGNRIIDPISDNSFNKKDSQKLISKVINFAKSISERINKKVPIVGSFSQRNGRDRYEVLDDLFTYLKSIDESEINIYPQWLPVYAWYFGGSVKLDLFNSEKDIDYVINNSIDICLDLCHLSLSAKYFNKDWRNWYSRLKPFVGHFHFADAVGVDGEGLPIGEGDIGDFSIFSDMPVMKIIEVWQGHHNGGIGFIKALNTLFEQEGKK